MATNTRATDYTGIYDGRPEPQRYEQPEEDKRLVQELNDWKRLAQQFRQPHERLWDLNWHFLKGDQALGRHKMTGEIVRLSAADSKKVRSTNNLLRPAARSLTGKLSRMTPTYRIDPASIDFAEQHGARVADQLLQFARQQHDLDNVYTALNSYLNWAGNSFVELAWDPTAGQDIVFCEICNYFDYDVSLEGGPCPTCSAQKQAEQSIAQDNAAANQIEAVTSVMEQLPPDSDITPEEIMQGGPQPEPVPQQIGPLPLEQEVPTLVLAKEGDIAVMVRDPRDVFISAGVLDVKKVNRILVRELMEVSEAAARYPHFAPFIKPDATIDAERTQTYLFQGPAVTDGFENLADHVFVYQYHEKPTVAYENGRLITVINDTIVEEKEHPIWKDIKRPPIYHFGLDVIEGEFYRDAWITQAWHRQREVNLTETQKREAIDLVLRPKLLNPIGSRITANEFTADSAQVIDHNAAAGRPEWMPQPDVPLGLWERTKELQQDILQQASVTEAQQGISTSDPNGRAMAILNAEADQQIGPIVRRNNGEWKEFNRAVLIMYQKYAHPQRIATTAGPEGLQSVYFGSLNLKPGWDIRMEEEDGLSKNPAVRLTQAMDLAKIGFFADPNTGMFDRKMFARRAGLQNEDHGADIEATERAAASQIPYLIMTGQTWQPRTFDVPALFKDELEKWLRGPGRRVDPMISQQVEQIWMYYTQWAFTQMMGQGGMPGGAPGQASQAGDDMSAPGGSLNGPGMLGTNIRQQAGQQVSEADQSGEKAARTSTQHEN